MIDDPTPFDPATHDAPTEVESGYESESVTTAYDLSGDGHYDIELTKFTDGSYYLVSDSDFDGAADTLSLDTTGDGSVDTQVVRLADGGYAVLQDLDGDGSFETEQQLTPDQLAEVFPGAIGMLDAHFDTVVDPDVPIDPDTPVDPNTPTNWVENGQLVGDPVGDSAHWFVQAQNGFCVPAVVAGIVGEYTGQDFTDESAFVSKANELGLFVVGMDGVPGMMPEGALALLEDSGVPAELTVGSIDSVAHSLEEGRRMIMFVDSGEIWYGEDTEDNLSDHVVSVTGIDYDRGVVIISDTGDPNGNMNEVPIATFEDAWADSGFAMIQCDDPAPSDGDTGVDATVGDTQGQDVSARSAMSGSEPTGHTGESTDQGTEAVLVQIQHMADWATEHSWALIPVALGAGVLAKKL